MLPVSYLQHAALSSNHCPWPSICITSLWPLAGWLVHPCTWPIRTTQHSASGQHCCCFLGREGRRACCLAVHSAGSPTRTAKGRKESKFPHPLHFSSPRQKSYVLLKEAGGSFPQSKRFTALMHTLCKLCHKSRCCLPFPGYMEACHAVPFRLRFQSATFGTPRPLLGIPPLSQAIRPDFWVTVIDS